MTRPATPTGWHLDRRHFLKLGGLAAAATAAGGLPLFHLREEALAAGLGDAGGARTPAKLGSWQDLYRQRWSWDHVAKGTHGWLNCRSACNFDLYVKDGIVVREEQSASYAASEPGVPDFNPRGCQKGACYTEVMYGPGRLSVPLKRVGARGGGQWEQISWDRALREIAEKLVEIAEKDGTDSIVHDLGPHFDHGPTTAGRVRFFGMLGATLSDDWAEIGDLNIGATLTFGFPHVGGSSDEWFLSDYLVVWMMNPSVTQIPDAHFLFEAKYDGAELVVIDPQYSATSGCRSDPAPTRPWRSPRRGTSGTAGGSTGPTCASRPTCRSWCAWTPDASSSRPTCARAGSPRSCSSGIPRRVGPSRRPDAAATAHSRGSTWAGSSRPSRAASPSRWPTARRPRSSRWARCSASTSSPGPSRRLPR
jgi:hypothetical protein